MNTSTFFDAFFKNRPKKEYIAIRSIKNKKDLDGSWYFASIGEASAKVQNIKESTNVYFGVCTRKNPGPSTNDVVTGYAVWADLDLGVQNHLTKMKIFKELNLLFEPSFVIDSGNGLHLYWLLNEPTNDMNLMEKTCRQVGMLVGGDDVFDRTRIMRLPGTLNLKQGPPGHLVQVIENNSSKRYALEDLYTISCLDPKYHSIISTGSSRGYKSRSHRDWAVVTSLIKCGASDELIYDLYDSHFVGDKASENEAYLPHTIKKARQRHDSGEDSSGGIVSEVNSSWHVQRNGKTRQISTYVFYPTSIIRSEGEPDIFVGDVQTQYGTTYKDIRFTQRDFVGSSSIGERTPFMDCAFMGTDADVRHILPYLFDLFRQSGGISRTLVKQTGYFKPHNVWVGTSQIFNEADFISKDDSLVVYDQRKEEGGSLRHEYSFEVDDPNQFNKFFDLMFKVNKDPVAASTAFGWTIASIFKSRFEDAGYRFPFLNVSGTRGAGKTTLIKEVLQPLVGYVQPRTYDCTTTRFVMLSLLGATTDIFISLSEFRQSAMSDQALRNLQRYLLLGYDSGFDPRGRANQTIKNYVISAPLTLDGEDAVSDPALMERSIHVRMTPDNIHGAEDILKDLTKLNLNQIGSHIIRFSLSYDYVSAIQWCESFIQNILKEMDIIVAARPIKNVAAVLFGIRFLEDFAEAYDTRVDCPILYRELVLGALGQIVNLESGRTRTQVDDFVEAVIAEASRMLTDFGTTSFPFSYESKENILWFNLATSYAWFRKHRRQQGLPTLEKESIELQMFEAIRGGEFLLMPKKIIVGGSALMCFGIDVGSASSVLDVPVKLSGMNVVIGETK